MGFAPIGMGTMDDLFHSVGISLDLKEELNRCFRAGAIDSAVPLSIWPDIPPGPHALPVFIPYRYLINSSVLHRTFRKEALSILAEIMVPEELFKVGIWDVSDFLNCLTVSRTLL